MLLKTPLAGLLYERPGPLPGTARLLSELTDGEQGRLLGLPGVSVMKSKRLGFEGCLLPVSLLEMGSKPAKLQQYTPDEYMHTPSGLELHRYQCRAVHFLRALNKENEGGILAGDPGSGKQQPIDAVISTPTGWRQIGDLAIGDLIHGSDGNAYAVTGVYPQGIKPSYLITFSDGSNVEAGPEHLWTLLYRKKRNKPYIWRSLLLTTEQLCNRPVLSYTGVNSQAYTLDLAKVKLYLPMLSAPLKYTVATRGTFLVHPYLLGQLIANGSTACGTPQLTTGVTNWSEILSNIEKTGHKPSSIRTYGNIVHANFKGLTKIIRKLGLDVLSNKKRIPKCYKEAEIADRLDLLHGLMDGDGAISQTRNKLSYSTTSYVLAQDVQELVEGLGGIASIRRCDRRKDNKGIEYSVRMRLPKGILPFTIKYRASRYNPGKNALPVRLVKSVEYLRDVESVCISVNSPDKLYVTKHCILTHNTIIALQSLWLDGFLQGPGIVIGPNLAKPTWCDTDSDAQRHYSLTLKPLEGIKNITPQVLNTWPWFFCHFEILHAWQAWIVYALRPRWLICDESHFLVNQKAQASEAARELSKAVAIEKRIVLTGTPIPNARIELWAQLAIAQPRQWGVSKHTFGTRYCAGELATAEEGGHWSYDGESNTDELKARLAGTMLRFTKYETEDSKIPEMHRHVIEAQIKDPRMMNEYSLAQTDVRAFLRMQREAKNLPQKISIGGKEMDAAKLQGGNAALTCFSSLISILSKIKRDSALKETIALLQKHTKIVVFTWHAALAKWLYKKLSDLGPMITEFTGKRGVGIYGPADRDMPIEKRKALATEFAASSTGVYVATLASVGTSINALAAADAGFMTELSWNTVRLIQGENRIQREGCPWPVVHMYYLICRNTIDDIFLKTLQEKVDVIAQINPHDVDGDYLVRDLSPTYISDEKSDKKLASILSDAILDKDWA